MIVLGLNAYHGDAAAAVLVDGKLAAAAEEERFTRIKHSAGFPVHAVRYCLDAVGAQLSDVNHLAIARDPRARLLRKFFFAVRLPRFALDRARVLGRYARVSHDLPRALDVDPARFQAAVHRIEHHRAHLASAFLASPCDRAALLSLDGFGDFGSALWGVGEGTKMQVLGGTSFPHSIGVLYTALTQYLGFPKYGDEYKVMGLASYGEPEHADEFRRLIRNDGRIGFSLDLRFFTHHRTGPGMTWDAGEPQLEPLYSAELQRLLGPARASGTPINPRHEAVAASLQHRLEDIVVHLVTQLSHVTGLDALAYAGGVAFNCVANGQILARTPITRLALHPAAGDAGLAVGAALAVWHQRLGYERDFVLDHAAWGPEYDERQLEHALAAEGIPYRRVPPGQIAGVAASHIARGRIVGWFQGRMEWGPRALGNRSILADPRDPRTKDRLNARVKHREPFRPFAPSVLEERVADWFAQSHPSPFMSLAYSVRHDRRDRIPAVTHVDGTARVQTVCRVTQPLYWDLLSEFETITGVPVLLNTSFNENEPIVNTPEEAVACFRRTDMDVLVLGPFVAEKGVPD